MKKLKLDDLQVDSFATTAAGEGTRTVQAHEAVTENAWVCSNNFTCPWGHSACGESCVSCYDTCANYDTCSTCYDTCNTCYETCTCPTEVPDC